MGRRSLPLPCLLAALASAPATIRADGGTVRLLERVDAYDVTVFTAPTPLRAGPVDISVLVVDPAQKRPVLDAVVTLHLAPADRPDLVELQPATRASSTNQFLYSAKFDLPHAGQWRIDLDIDGPLGPARTRFDLDALDPLPRWTELWMWIALPAIPIILFGLYQTLVRRRKVG